MREYINLSSYRFTHYRISLDHYSRVIYWRTDCICREWKLSWPFHLLWQLQINEYYSEFLLGNAKQLFETIQVDHCYQIKFFVIQICLLLMLQLSANKILPLFSFLNKWKSFVKYPILDYSFFCRDKKVIFVRHAIYWIERANDKLWTR